VTPIYSGGNFRCFYEHNCRKLLPEYTALHARRMSISSRIHDFTFQKNINFYQNRGHHIPEECIIHSHNRHNLESNILSFVSSSLEMFIFYPENEWKNTEPFVRHIPHLQRRRNIVNVDFINMSVQYPLHFPPFFILRLFIYTAKYITQFRSCISIFHC
jgi:hypothetical protein